MSKKENKNNFENSLKRLEAIVDSLEQGEVSLEESLKMFEEGIRLSKECLETLGKAELTVKQLTKDLNGKFQQTEFEEQ
ncbi:MAG: exodeoxyribonuclease VII small subunit [Ignavibacteriales bacterium]|nr:exodeoxyribonuclease VII small subunit [Ignavibacteriales bacterium]